MRIRTGKQMIARLTRTRPDVAITITFTPDPNTPWDGDGPSPADDGFDCYDVDVTATAIRKGVFVRGSSSLGSSWYRPDALDREINGYAPQMIAEALEELDVLLGGGK